VKSAARKLARRLAAASGAMAGLVALLIFCLGPLAWQVLTSLKPPADLVRLPPLLPGELSFASYREVFEPGRHFARIIVNSLAVAGTTTVAVFAIGGLAAFALAKLDLRGKRLLLGAVLAVSMFPPIATVSPLYLIIRALGLRDELAGLVLPYTTFALPLAIWNLTAFFREVPDELYRAARIDGCSPLGAFRHVVLPLAAPGVLTTAILVFIYCWNEFLYALTFTATERSRTVPVGIALFPGVHEVPWGEIAAASTVVTAPLVLLVLVFQRRIAAGLTAGAVKG
jgi:multiple sugar transport system permease protein